MTDELILFRRALRSLYLADVLIILLIFGGCSSSKPSMDLSQTGGKSSRARIALLALQYPEAEFITAWGYSNCSQREAELDAKARLSEQISSSIVAETEAVATAWMHDGVVTDKQLLKSKVLTETSFNRAELIRLDIKSTSYDEQGRYRVFAYLHRSELGVELEATYMECAFAFRAEVERALKQIHNPFRFTPAWHAAMNRFDELFSLACKQQVVLCHLPPTLLADRQPLQDLERGRIELLTNLNIAINLHHSPDIDTGAMAAAIEGGLIRLGINAHDGDCSGESTLYLELKPEVVWRQLLGARFCKVQLLGELQICSDNNVKETIVITGPIMEGRGTNPVGSLAKRVTAESLAPLLMETLRSILPLQHQSK